MNLSLQDPFAVAKEYPEQLTQTLQYGHSTVMQFSHRGDYLASGLSDGTIAVYDLSTNMVVALLQHDAHIRPVTSLSWSRCGRFLLSSSQDWSVKLWDLSRATQTSALVRTFPFDGPIWSAQFHPEKPAFVASILDDEPVYVCLREQERDEEVNGTSELSNGTSELSNGVHEQNGGVENEVDKMDVDPKDSSDSEGDNLENEIEKDPLNYYGLPTVRTFHSPSRTLVSIFSHCGNYIFAGTNKGELNVYRVANLELVFSHKVTSANIKNLIISTDGRKMAINASDRIIRQVALPDLANAGLASWDLEVEHKYQDVVNRLQWNAVAFNYNAEFLVASTFGQSSHDLYVWETSMGSLVKILEGSNEELLDVKWNYARCCIASAGLDSGAIYIWSVQFPQKWSALAPDFVEIDENIEYEEKEDEFDIIDEDEMHKRRLEEEDAVVDIVTRERVDARGFEMLDGFVIPIKYE